MLALLSSSSDRAIGDWRREKNVTFFSGAAKRT